MADLSKMIYKLQTALKQKGVIVYINTIQFYSEEQNRFIKVYKILNKSHKIIISTASQIKAVETLNEIWQEVKDNIEERNS